MRGEEERGGRGGSGAPACGTDESEEMKRSSPTGDVSTPPRRKSERRVAHPASCLPPDEGSTWSGQSQRKVVQQDKTWLSKTKVSNSKKPKTKT